MLKRKNLQIFFDGSLIINKFNITVCKKKKFIFHGKNSIFLSKECRLPISGLVKDLNFRRKYF
jgi:hypothetical protein